MMPQTKYTSCLSIEINITKLIKKKGFILYGKNSVLVYLGEGENKVIIMPRLQLYLFLK